MTLTDADVERIARRAAELVWQRPTRNTWGDVVAAEQILTATEWRVADTQTAMHGLTGTGAAVDLDALAGKVLDLLTARLAG